MQKQLNSNRLILNAVIFAFAGALAACSGGSGTPSASVPTVKSCATKINAKVGKMLTLSSLGHAVSGKATVVDDCTIELTNFNYDGGGRPDVYVWGGKSGDYKAGFRTGDNLFGTPRSNATVTVNLKVGDLDNLDGISIWCEGARVSFGDGLFN
jgi:hypothetical protein